MSNPTFARIRPSRRYGGPVVDVDLNPGRTCPWRCAFCDVEGLRDGDVPDPDLSAVGAAVAEALQTAPPDLAAVVISGSGEPMTVYALDAAVRAVVDVAGGRSLALYTNGARATRPNVRVALKLLAEAGGEAWLRLDSVTREGRVQLLRDDTLLRQVRENLRVTCNSVPTWIQTVVFGVGGEAMPAEEEEAYLSFLRNQLAARVPIRGVVLTTPQRPTAQETAGEIVGADSERLQELAGRLRELGVEVRVVA